MATGYLYGTNKPKETASNVGSPGQLEPDFGEELAPTQLDCTQPFIAATMQQPPTFAAPITNGLTAALTQMSQHIDYLANGNGSSPVSKAPRMEGKDRRHARAHSSAPSIGVAVAPSEAKQLLFRGELC